MEQLEGHSRSTSPANGIFHTPHQSTPPHMSNFIILSPAPVPSMSFPTEVLKVTDCSFNLRANSLLHIGKDVLTSYVGKMVESLFFRFLQLSHTDTQHIGCFYCCAVLLSGPRETEERKLSFKNGQRKILSKQYHLPGCTLSTYTTLCHFFRLHPPPSRVTYFLNGPYENLPHAHMLI